MKNFEGEPLGKHHFEKRKGDGNMILKCVSGVQIVTMGISENWLGIAFSGGLWYIRGAEPSGSATRE
jgi:hypothetical protein